MKNTFGNNVTITLFGESHGDEIGAVIDGIMPGIKIENDFIADKLSKRRPCGKISTQRTEKDNFRIVSGVFEGYTTGTPVCILIQNENKNSSDYSRPKIPRPSHADYTAEFKYHGFQDYRGGGHFSGRLTAPIVAAGAIASLALEKHGIKIGTHILEAAGVPDDTFGSIENDIKKLENSVFPVLNEVKGERMREKAEKAAEAGDSVGGILETAVIGMPCGVGEPWFDTIEGMISHAVYSIPAVKGVEFGLGFAFADMYGSEANDAFVTDGKKTETLTNNNGGINGGISNGMPIIFKTAIKPTPSIYKEQKSINLETNENVSFRIEGRHDPMIVHRAAPVVDAMTALVILDFMTGRYGYEGGAIL